MTPKLVYYFFMERLEQETANKLPETEQTRAKSEILRFINGLGRPIQNKLEGLVLTRDTKEGLVKNLVAIGYQKTPLDKSDFYVKKALLLEGIKGKEEYSYGTINNLIVKFEKTGARGTTENQRKLIQFYLYERGFYPPEYITGKNISLFDACDGFIGTNTLSAIANFKTQRKPSETAVLKMEGDMTSDSIRKPSAIPSQVAVVPQQMDMPSTEQSNAVKTSSTETIAHPNVWSARLGKLCDQYVRAA